MSFAGMLDYHDYNRTSHGDTRYKYCIQNFPSYEEFKV